MQPGMPETWLTAADTQAAHAMEEGAGGFMRWLGKHAREMGRDIGLVMRIPTFNIVVLQARHMARVQALLDGAQGIHRVVHLAKSSWPASCRHACSHAV